MALKDLIRSGPAPKAKRKGEAIQPIKIDDVTWMYPLKRGLSVIHEVRDREKYIRTDTINIKWVDVGIAVEHHKALKKKGAYDETC